MAATIDAGVDGVDADSYTLTIAIAGTGSGVVSSTPAGFTCSEASCAQTFTAGSQVMLSQSPTTGSFLGWTNDCTGSTACSVTMDRDRIVTAMFGTPGEALWSRQFGGTMQDYVNAVAIDGEGGLIVVGDFSESFVSGTTTLTSAGQQDVFVAKLSGVDGSVTWIKSVGGAGFESSTGVALDAENNIYISGSFRGVSDLGGGALDSNGNVNGFALKLDSAGGYVWAKHISGTSVGVSAIAVRGSSVAIAGSYHGSMTVNGMMVNGTGSDRAYLATSTTSGTAGFVKTFPGTGTSLPNNVVVDHAGNFLIAGNLSGSADFGAGTVSSAMSDVFFAKYSSAGAYIAAKVLGQADSDYGGLVSVDPADNIFVAGTYDGSVSFGDQTPVDASIGNLVIAKYSAAGAYQWAQVYGGDTAIITPSSIAANSAGDVVVSGSFCGSATIGETFVASVGTCASNDHDIFAARFAGNDGSALRATRAGGSSADIGYDIVQASDGRHFVVGAFQGFADFAGTSLSSAGGFDGVVLALAPL